jgi:hypothetical protein
MKRVGLALLLMWSIANAAATFAAEPDAIVVARSIGCYRVDIMHRYDELFQSGERRAAQSLLLNALAKSECIILPGKTRAAREQYLERRTCIRPDHLSSCIWVENPVLRAW